MDTKIEKLQKLLELSQDEINYLLGEIDEKKSINAKPEIGVYVVKDGHVYYKLENGDEKILANFITMPVAIIIHDSYGETQKYIRLIGQMHTGRQLCEIDVPLDEFDAMKWIRKYWALEPRVKTSMASSNIYRDYIQSQAENLPTLSVFKHTGFRKIDEKLVYLYHGGAIGDDHIRCQLDNELSEYRFCNHFQISEIEASQFMYVQLKGLASPRVMLTLIAFFFLAPLTYFLKESEIEPSFALFLRGETSSFKTTLALLMLSFFRTCSPHSPSPTNFESTANAIEKYQHDLKDMILVVDDYHPTLSSKKEMDDKVQRIARNSGDHASRKRLNSDSSQKKAYTPRGLTLITGEDTPDISRSGLARFYFLDIKKDEVNQEKLTDLQTQHYILNAAMEYYIKFLIDQSATLSEKIRGIFLDRRQMASKNNQHARTASNCGWLFSGIFMFFEYLCANKIISVEQAATEKELAWAQFLSIANEQNEMLATEEPYLMFIHAISEMLSTKQKTLILLGAEEILPENYTSNAILGYHDSNYYYFTQSTTCSAVREFFRRNERSFPISDKRLMDDLQKHNLLYLQSGRRTVKLPNKTSRFLKMDKSAFK